MTKKIIVLLLLFTPLALWRGVGGEASAQCTVKGVLFDEKNGEAVPFANVVLYQGDQQTPHGCATDINGFFLINKVPEGNYTLKVKYVGYEEYSSPQELKKGKTVTLTIHLKPMAQTLKTVEITDNRIEERKMQTQVSV